MELTSDFIYIRTCKIIIAFNLIVCTIKEIRYAFDPADPAELAADVAKDGVWLSVAEGFEWGAALVAVDSRKAYAETRFTGGGLIGDRLHVMVFSLRDTTVRLISLRRANSREVKRYVDHS